MKPKLLCCAAVLIAAVSASAGPLQRGDVATEATWVLHFDFDALRSTTIGQYLIGEMNKPEAQAKLAVFQTLSSIDLRSQLHGATLYSTGKSPEDGVLVVYADFQPDRLTTLAKAAKDSQNTTHSSYTIYNWIDEKKKARDGVKPRVYAAIAGNRVIFGQKETPVSKALDVIDRAVPTLSTSSTFSQLGASDSNFIQGAARQMDINDPNAAIFKLSKAVRLGVGETAKQVNATLALEAGDAEVAANINNIAQGLVSLMKLQKDKPESVKFAEAINLKQDGATVTASVSLPADDVIAAMKADAAKKAAKKAQAQQSK